MWINGLGEDDSETSGNFGPDVLNYYMQYFSEWAGMPSNFLMYVAMKESSYNPTTGWFRNVCNSVNACGLMQLRPIALRDIYNNYKITIDPLNPILAIVGAALLVVLNRRYLRYYLGYNPDIVVQLAAYNGGWQAGYRLVTTGNFVSAENRNYVVVIGRQLGVV